MARKTYRGTALDVSFDLDICTHAGECVSGLPLVFDTERRPWILPDQAEAAALRAVIGRCPSGALAIVEHGEAASTNTAGGGPVATTIRVLRKGPLLVEGPFTVVDASGARIDHGAKAALCRCGRSAR